MKRKLIDAAQPAKKRKIEDVEEQMKVLNVQIPIDNIMNDKITVYAAGNQHVNGTYERNLSEQEI